ncbi:hypothetical protein B0T10DRAFT_500142 [Thelonectria olida]|uniref:Secreted protein n=1 Tax=Thelonectria olida TaxID=1576542 RepID=A0A9P8VS48_9HYPO|nr:hypothetical protein B0T10DRAFT_500142 [Thelonectria olida]
MPRLRNADRWSSLLLLFVSAFRLREDPGIHSPFELASSTDHTVFFDITSRRSHGLNQGRGGIESIQYVVGPVEDVEDGVALKTDALHSRSLSRA